MQETTKAVIGLVAGLVSAGWSLYMTYLLYNLVGATQLMWFMYWMLIPMLLIVHGISAIIKRD